MSLGALMPTATDPTFSAHRKGLEEQVLELSSLYRRSQLQVKEYKDLLRKADVKIGGLEDGAAAANEAATLSPSKTTAGIFRAVWPSRNIRQVAAAVVVGIKWPIIADSPGPSSVRKH